MFLMLVKISLLGAEPLQAFLEQLPKETACVLDSGIRRVLQSFGGYVLYGDKPMCIESFKNELQSNLYHHETATAKYHLFTTLKQWALTSTDRKYLFLFTNYADHTHLIIINRNAFIQAVNNNLSLFRYVIGPKLTAESLLTSLAEDQEHFYDVIHDDLALLGILLGYGTNNSIAHRFNELALKAIQDTKLNFPYLQNEARTVGCEHLIQAIEDSPNRSGSWDLSTHVDYRIPCFGCNPDSEETTSLLKTYEKNRNELIKATEQENFLESFLTRIFTTTSNELKLPKISHQSDFDLNNPKSLLEGFASTVWIESQVDGKNMAESFLNGILDCEKGKTLNPDVLEAYRELFPLSIDIRDRQNLERSEQILVGVSKLKGWIPLIEQNVLYKTVKKGYGPSTSSKAERVTFHYSFRGTKNPKKVCAGTIERAKTESLIPGLAHLLIGMKKGEERLTYIHPRYAYGDRAPYSNEAIVANVQLINFEEGNNEVRIAPEQSIDSKQVFRLNGTDAPSEANRRKKPQGSSKELSAQYEKLQEQLIYLNGYRFWEAIKHSDIILNCDKLIKKVQSGQFQILDERERIAFILDFKAHLFHKKYLAGELPILPFCF